MSQRKARFTALRLVLGVPRGAVETLFSVATHNKALLVDHLSTPTPTR